MLCWWVAMPICGCAILLHTAIQSICAVFRSPHTACPGCHGSQGLKVFEGYEQDPDRDIDITKFSITDGRNLTRNGVVSNAWATVSLATTPVCRSRHNLTACRHGAHADLGVLPPLPAPSAIAMQVEGHAWHGERGDEPRQLLSYVEARRKIYVPAFTWVIENVPAVRNEVVALARAATQVS